MASQGLLIRRPVITSPPSLSGCTVMNDGNELNLGGLRFAFWRRGGILPAISSSHIPGIKNSSGIGQSGNRYPGQGFFPTFFTGYADYLATIDHLAAIDPMILGLAHNGLFSRSEDIKETFQKSGKPQIMWRHVSLMMRAMMKRSPEIFSGFITMMNSPFIRRRTFWPAAGCWYAGSENYDLLCMRRTNRK